MIEIFNKDDARRDAVDMPKRDHGLKFQVTIPFLPAMKAKVQPFMEDVVNKAAIHLRALAGGGAYDVVVKAAYQDRGPDPTGTMRRDILVACAFNGLLTEEAKRMQHERITHEFKQANDSISVGGVGGLTGSKVLIS